VPRQGAKLRTTQSLVTLTLVSVFGLAAGPAASTPLLIPDGMTVIDTSNDVTWLQNADLAASAISNPIYYFGVAPCSATKTSDCINQSGSMDYQAAKDWISGMNAADFLGHNNWQLPATPPFDGGCSGIGSQNESFAFGCSGSAMGSLNYTALGLNAANSAVPTPPSTVGPFTNLQPNLY
jgi:hypothetical protein